MDTKGIISEIKTARLHIKALSLEQLKTRLISPHLLEMDLGWIISQPNLTKAERRAVVIKIMKMEASEKEYHPWFTFWLISQNKDHKVVGMIGFKGMPFDGGNVEIGYGINPPFQNNGFATEAVKAMVRWAAQYPICKAVIAETDRSNLASQRVLAKAGLRIYEETELSLLWRIETNPSS